MNIKNIIGAGAFLCIALFGPAVSAQNYMPRDASTATSTAFGNLVTAATAASARTSLGLGTGNSPTFTGLTLSSMTQGSVLFAGASGVVSQDNSNFFWDATNHRLGIGTVSPGNSLEVVSLSSATSGTSIQGQLNDTNTNISNNHYGVFGEIFHHPVGGSAVASEGVIGLSYFQSAGTYSGYGIGVGGTAFACVQSVAVSCSSGTVVDVTGFLAGIYGSAENHGAGAVSNAIGIFADAAANVNTGAGSITNSYGVYITPPTAGSTNNAGLFFSDTGNATSTHKSIATVTGNNLYISTPSALTDFADGAIRLRGYAILAAGTTVEGYIGAYANITGSGPSDPALYTNTGKILLANGNVLIGTTTDGGQKLQVDGTSSLSGLATFGGQVNVTAMTQTAAAQSGTVCYNVGTGAVTYDATVGCLASTSRIKRDIKPLSGGLDTVMALHPSTFYRTDFGAPNEQQIGLIAEQVAGVDARLVAFDDSGLPRGWSQSAVLAELVAAVQHIKHEIDLMKENR